MKKTFARVHRSNKAIDLFRKKGAGSQILALFLIIGFLTSPTAPVFAQESLTMNSGVQSSIIDASTISSSADSNTILTDIVTNPPSSPGLNTSDVSSPIPEENVPTSGDILGASTENELTNTSLPADTPEDKKPDEPVILSLSEEDTDIPQEAKLSRPDLSTRDRAGAFEHSVPIAIPPGRNGLQPDLKLSYNSREDEINNLFGYGWSTNIPYIQRINRTGSEDLYSASTTNYLFSSLDGELATTSSATTTKTFAPLVENGSFLSYSLTNNVWTVYDKKGTRYSFGTTSASRRDDPLDSSKVYTWFLEEVRDTNNNYIKYEYVKDAGQVYPSAITYTGNGSTDGIFKIEFLRTSRTDTASSTAPGFHVRSKYVVNEIDVKISNVLTHKYVMTHTTGDNTTRLLLNTITETGYAEDATPTALPAMTFSYQVPVKNWTQDANYVVPVTFSRAKDDRGVVVDDVNGDALPDLIKSWWNGSDTTIKAVYINDGNGTGWTQDSNYTIPVTFTRDRYDEGVRVVDVNGDGFADIIKSWTNDGGSVVTKAVYINSRDGTGWTLAASTTIPVTFVTETSDQGVRLMDVNGDGLIDMVKSWTDGGGTTVKAVYINSGDGTAWVQDSNYTIPITFTRLSYDQGVRAVDVNNDNLPDLVRSWWNGTDTTNKEVYINKGDGTGWTQDPRYVIPVTFTRDKYDEGVRIFDVNGDSLPDIVKAWTNGVDTTIKAVYINDGDGTGWTEDANYTVPVTFHNDSSGDGVRIADVDGDGRADLIRAWTSAGDVDTKAVYISGDYKADLLKQIDFPEGGTITASYKNTAEYHDGTPLANPSLPLLLTTVNAIGRNDGFGTIGTTTYSYGGGYFYYNNAYDKKFAGFATTTKTDPAGNVTKEYAHQGDSSNSSLGEYNDHISKVGKIYRIEKYDGLNNLYQKVINRWDRYNQATNRDFVKLIRSIDFAYDGNASHRDLAKEYTYDDTSGNLATTTTWGEVNGSDDGTFTDTGSDKGIQATLFVSNTGNHVIGLPYQDTLTDQSANKVRETRTYYDTLSLGSVGAGNLTKVEQWKSASLYASSTKAYNTTYGIVTSSTDPRGKTTSYTYDTFNLHASTSTNPLSQVTGYLYDYSSGKVKQITDPNSLITQTTFDGLDRPLQEKQPDLTTPSILVTKTDFTYTDTSGAKSVLKTSYLNSATSTLVYQYFDGFNRLIQERKESENASEYFTKDVVYNNVGLTQKESLPYASTGTSRTSATTTSALFANYSYDPLQRVLSIANAVGTTSYAYDNWTATTTDANGKSKAHTKDAYGNLVNVNEVNSGSTYATQYQWNLNSKLTKITDALSNIRNFTYDGLGRRLTAEDLHDSADGTYGTWTYIYDAANNLTQTTDPKSQTINYTYDDINRVLTEDYTGTGGIEITYEYDSCTDGVGRLCVATTTDVISTYAYNPLGLVASETKKINDTDYITGYTYDRLGNLTDITYPDSSIVTYGYNTAGLLETVARKPDGTSEYLTAVSELDYAPTGAISLKRFGNGVVSTYTYDPSQLYRLTNILTVASSTIQEGGGGTGGPLGLLEWPSYVAAPLNAILAKATPQWLIQAILGEEVEETTETETTITEEMNSIENEEILVTTTQETVEIEEAVSTTPAIGEQEYTATQEMVATTTSEQLEYVEVVVDETSEDQKEQTSATLPPALIESISAQLRTSGLVQWGYGAPVGNSYTLNVFEGGGLKYADSEGYISFEPSGLSWDDETNIRSAEKGSYQKTGKDSHHYNGVFGEGTSLDVKSDERNVRKDVTIDSLSSLGTIPEGTRYLKIEFKVDTNFTVPTGRQTGKFKLSEYSTMLTPEAWDSYQPNRAEIRAQNGDLEETPRRNQVDIEWEFKKDGDGYMFIKYIPIEWLKSAQYPITADVDVSYGSQYEFDTGYLGGVRVVPLASDKFVVCWTDVWNSSEEGKCIVASVSGTTISYGSASQFASDITGYSGYQMSACKAGTDKFAVVYSDDTSTDEGYIRFASVSGTSITGWGTAVQLAGTNDLESFDCVDVDTDKVVIIYNNESTSDEANSIVCTASGTTATCGSEDDWSSTDYFPTYTSVAKLDTDKFLGCTPGWDTGTTVCVAGTVSGTTITHGTVLTLDSTATDVPYVSVAALNTDSAVVGIGDAFGTEDAWTYAVTASGTTLTNGSSEGLVSSSPNFILTLAEHDTTHFAALWAEDTGSALAGKSNYGSVDFGTRTVTAGTTETFDASGVSADDYGFDVTYLGDDKLVVCFSDNDDSADGKCLIGELPSGGGGNSAPSAPTSLETEGQTNPTTVTDPTPEFSAIYNDSDSGDIATSYQIQVATSSAFSAVFWDSTKTTLASSTPEGTRIADISYGGSALASSTTYYWRIKFWDDSDDEGAWSTATSTFELAATGNSAPTAPTSLETEGATNPTGLSDSTPEFTAVYNDPDGGDQAIFYNIQVATTSDFASTYWDSGKTVMATTTQGNEIPDISYAGSALASSTTYYWRVKFWDDDDAEGVWSTATSTFSLASGGGGGGGLGVVLQNIFYTYDSVGNITTISDYSDTGAGKIVNFGYDDLHRLTSASTVSASSTSFSRTYTYDAIGDLLTKSDQGTYEYAETGYVNPQAVTSIGNGVATTTYAYDNNGNLTSAGGLSYTWDYRNRLTQSSDGAATTYEYDHENQRVRKATGGITTVYPNSYFNASDATTTIHVMLPDGSLVATVEEVEGEEGSGVATSTDWKTAGTVEVNTGWDNLSVSSLASSDDDKASCDPTCDDSDAAEVSDFGFGVPSGATIDGIEVRWECQGVAVSTLEPRTSLSWNDGGNYTTEVVTPSCPANSDGTITMGGSTDTWGRTWSISELADGTFRLKIDKETLIRELQIDQLQVKIHYTPVVESSSATTTSYMHTDHLGGMNVSSDENGLATEIVDFLPFGAERFRDGDSQDQRQFAGTERDQESNLDYMINRYYSSDTGRFLSQDPSFLDIGSAGFEQRYGRTLQQHLAMPQTMHSYSYALNNPIINKDPEGEIVPLLVGAYLAFEIGLSAYDAYTTAQTLTSDASLGEKAAVGGLFLGGLLAPGGGYAQIPKLVDKVGDAAKGADNVSDGVIYLRTDATGNISKPYVGQTKSSERFLERQKEHQRANPNSKFEFNVLNNGTPGTDLNLKEQSHLNQLGGPTNKSNPDGGTSNKKNVIRQN